MHIDLRSGRLATKPCPMVTPTVGAQIQSTVFASLLAFFELPPAVFSKPPEKCKFFAYSGKKEFRTRPFLAAADTRPGCSTSAGIANTFRGLRLSTPRAGRPNGSTQCLVCLFFPPPANEFLGSRQPSCKAHQASPTRRQRVVQRAPIETFPAPQRRLLIFSSSQSPALGPHHRPSSRSLRLASLTLFHPFAKAHTHTRHSLARIRLQTDRRPNFSVHRARLEQRHPSPPPSLVALMRLGREGKCDRSGKPSDPGSDDDDVKHNVVVVGVIDVDLIAPLLLVRVVLLPDASDPLVRILSCHRRLCWVC